MKAHFHVWRSGSRSTRTGSFSRDGQAASPWIPWKLMLLRTNLPHSMANWSRSSSGQSPRKGLMAPLFGLFTTIDAPRTHTVGLPRGLGSDPEPTPAESCQSSNVSCRFSQKRRKYLILLKIFMPKGIRGFERISISSTRTQGLSKTEESLRPSHMSDFGICVGGFCAIGDNLPKSHKMECVKCI